MGDSFTHLHVHTEFSMLDGAARLEELVAKAVADGQPALGITDHGNMYGILEFYKECRKQGLKPVLGTEAYMADESRAERPARRGRIDDSGGDTEGGKKLYYHLTLLAESDAGYRNLIQLSSLAFMEGYYYKPRLDWELLERHHDGLIATTGCLGGHVLQSLLQGDAKAARAKAGRLQDIFGRDNLFVELQDHGLPAQRQTNPQLVDIAKAIGAPLVVTNDSHYVHRSDHQAHDALLCVQTGATLDDPKRFKFEGEEHYLKTAAEMRHLFGELPTACDNTLWIAERADVEIEFGKPQLPDFPLPEGFTDDAQYLRHLTFDGADRRWGRPLPADAAARLEYELEVIERMGYASYFLIVWDLIKHAKDQGIRVGPGRGSAAGCAVAYCLRITELDPIRYDLLFERFLNPDRISMPDIDMDFDSRYRDEMIAYAAQRYGRDHVAQIITFGTIKARNAVRDAARVLGHPYAVGDRIAKAMPPLVMGRDTPLKYCFEQHEKYADGYKAAAELRAMYEIDDDVRRVVDVAKGLEGLKRSDGIHAAAVVITKNPLTDYLPVQRKPEAGVDPALSPVVTQFEMHGVEELGLLKMDFLGLRNLDVITDTVELIRAAKDPGFDIDSVPLDDLDVYALLSTGNTMGVFQLESPPMRALLRSMSPTSFDDIAALIALYRPGPMGANMHYDYADRKNGRQQIEFFHDDAKEVLADTFGLMIYQESVMRVAQKFAGYTLAEADNLRKACLAKGTRLLTRSRGYVPIEQIMALGDRRVQTIDTVSANSRCEEVADVWSVGTRPVLCLRTATGYEIVATAEHPFLVDGRWVQLGDIAPGDLVGVAGRTFTDGDGRVTDAEIDLAALLLAEGHTPANAGGHFCHTDPELIEAFATAYRSVFGRQHRGRFVQQGVTVMPLSRAELSRLRPLLNGLEPSAAKSVSGRILNASGAHVERFLGLYFCCDGWAESGGVAFGTNSRQMALDLKRLLLRIGIVGHVLSGDIAGRGRHYAVSVADEWMAKRFARSIGPHLTATKDARVERRHTLGGLLVSERLEDLRSGDLLWDTVESVEPAGEVECFDFRMANPERPYALADDVLVHNCGKKSREIMARERAGFEAGCERTGYGRALGTELFDVIERFADYAFNKSHSFGYGLITYQTAYLKAHYPVEYMAALLSSVKGNLEKAAVYLSDARAMGIKVLTPDINHSVMDFAALEPAAVPAGVVLAHGSPGAITFGLSAVRNVGEGLVAQLLAERAANGPYDSFYDFAERVPEQVLNKRTVESLIRAGAFDGLGHPRRGLVMVFERIIDATLLRRRERDQGVMSLFDDADGSAEGEGFDERVSIPDLEFDKADRLKFEKEMLGLYVSDHPLLGVEGALRRKVDCTVAEAAERDDATVLVVGGVITGLARKFTKAGKQMAVFTLEDLDASIEVTVFPRTLEEQGYKLVDDAIVTVRGRIDKRDEGRVGFMAQEVTVLEGLDTTGNPPLRLKLPATSLNELKIHQLRKILGEHPGGSAVFLHVGQGRVLQLADEFCVDLDRVIGELRVAFGHDCVML